MSALEFEMQECFSGILGPEGTNAVNEGHGASRWILPSLIVKLRLRVYKIRQNVSLCLQIPPSCGVKLTNYGLFSMIFFHHGLNELATYLSLVFIVGKWVVS